MGYVSLRAKVLNIFKLIYFICSINTLKEECKNYEKSLKEQNEFLDEIQVKNNNLETKIAQLEQQNETFKQAATELEAELSTVKNNLQQELTMVQNNCIDFEDTISILKSDHLNLKQVSPYFCKNIFNIIIFLYYQVMLIF